jgi:hypothetical protein
MHCTQIPLEGEQYQALLRESGRRRMSLAAIIRKLIREHLSSNSARSNPLDKLA